MLMKWLLILMAAIAPLNPLSGTDANCTHPPVPPLLTDYNSHIKYADDSFYMSKFRLRKLGLGKYVDLMRNCPIEDPFDYSIRNSDPENPGYYFQYPWCAINIDLSSIVTVDEIDYVETLLSAFISDDYYTQTLGDSIENVYLNDLERQEFFFDARLNDIQFRFSGWYGKFGHIFVLTDYNSVDGFIEMAQKFYKLPKLDKSKVSFSENIEKNTGYRDFFYSYDDSEAGFRLYGYPNTKRKREEGTLIHYHDHVILDLTVYPEEE